MGMTEAVARWSPYIQNGLPFSVVVDHQALVYLMKAAVTEGNKRILHYLLDLQSYRFTIIYKKGGQHLDADAVSRLFQFRDRLSNVSDLPEHSLSTFEPISDTDLFNLNRRSAETKKYKPMLQANMERHLQQFMPSNLPSPTENTETITSTKSTANPSPNPSQKKRGPYKKKAPILFPTEHPSDIFPTDEELTPAIPETTSDSTAIVPDLEAAISVTSTSPPVSESGDENDEDYRDPLLFHFQAILSDLDYLNDPTLPDLWSTSTSSTNPSFLTTCSHPRISPNLLCRYAAATAHSPHFICC
jgi:hypothetical protein